jgi:hypothetical protein
MFISCGQFICCITVSTALSTVVDNFFNLFVNHFASSRFGIAFNEEFEN